MHIHNVLSKKTNFEFLKFISFVLLIIFTVYKHKAKLKDTGRSLKTLGSLLYF